MLSGRLAIKHHPDKNRDDPNAEERFKEIAIAYQTLSDPALRKKYNEFGSKETQPEGGFVDPEEVFSAIFGGDRFVPIIGEISLGKDMKAALQEAEEAEDEGENKNRLKDAKGNDILTPEEKAKKEEKARKAAAEVCHWLTFAPSFLTIKCSETSCTRSPSQEAGGGIGAQIEHIHGVCRRSERQGCHRELADDLCS